MSKDKKKINNSGQAVLEYILLVVAVLSAVLAFFHGSLRIRNYVWKEMASQIVAPCPGCPVSEISQPAIDGFK